MKRKINLFLINVLLVSTAIAENPQRIISLAPSLTKNLYLLEAGELLVGCTNYCVIQSETKAQVVANAVQVNYEKIILLKPDLVITTNLTKARTIDTFKKLGIPVLVFENPKSFDEICSQFIELGHRIGKKAKAETVIVDAKIKLKIILKKVPKQSSNQRILMQIGANPLFAVVPNTFMQDYIAFSKTENIANDLKLGNMNLESVLVRNPDIIIVVLMGTMGKEEKERWQRFTSLNAVRKNQVFIMDADNACSPTPISFVDALEEMVQLIYSN